MPYPNPLSHILHYHFNSNPSANFKSYKGNIKSKYATLQIRVCTNIQGSSIVMKVLPVYQKIDFLLLQCYAVICVKNSQSSKSTMPTKIIHPARFLLQIQHGKNQSIHPPKKSGCPRGTLRHLHFPCPLPSGCSSSGGSMLSGYCVCRQILHFLSGEGTRSPQLILKRAVNRHQLMGEGKNLVPGYLPGGGSFHQCSGLPG